MSFVQYMKPLVVTDIETEVNKSIQCLINYLDLANKVLPILKPFDGKEITKRIETAIKKALPEYTISYTNAISASISIWGNGINYDNRVTLYMSKATNWGSNNILDYAKTEAGFNTQGLKADITKKTKGFKEIEYYVNQYNQLLINAQKIVEMATNDGMEYIFDLANNAKK